MLVGPGGRRRPGPPPRGARGGRRLHLRGSPRRVHPAGRWPPGPPPRLELATNVAIAFPRNPVQLAHQAYDLQLLSQGRFTLGLGSQIRAQVEKRYGASFDRPIARMRELVAALRAIFATLGDGRAARLPGRVQLPHPDAPDVQPRAPTRSACRPSPSAALGPRWCAWPPRWPTGCWSCRSTPPRHFRQRTAAGHRGGSGPGGPEAVGAHGDRRGHRVLRPRRGGDGRGPRRRAVAAGLLRLHPGLPPGPGGRGVGGPPARAQHALQVGPLGGDAGHDRRHHAGRPWPRWDHRPRWPPRSSTGSAARSTGWASTPRTRSPTRRWASWSTRCGAGRRGRGAPA